MSSSLVRTTARAFVDDGSFPAGLPFRETVDQLPDEGRPDPSTTPAWCTLDFEVSDDERLGIGAETLRNEEGRIFLFCFGAGNQGDAAILTLAEQALAAANAYDWGAIYLAQVIPPTAIEMEDETWAVYAIVIAYELYHS